MTDWLYRSLRPWPWWQRQMKRALVRLPHRWREVTHFGQRLRVDPSELAGFWLYYEQDYDDYIFEFLAPRLARFERAIDVGAHYGIYSVFFGARMKRVDVFEANPSTARRLRANLALNGQANVRIHEVCLTNVDGQTNFYVPPKVNEGLGRVALPRESGVSVPAQRLDTFLGGAIAESCLIKLDIEGGEWLALEGSQRVLDHPRHPVALLIEVHPENIQAYGGSVPEFRRRLEAMGYCLRGLTPAGLVPLTADPWPRFWWGESQ
ncbi:MAG TPA: FkbM family methyltransferase [Elusimicrobiota bacterium]|nr:FkbM family methyltransferase [Elusimicrobiota bacterium]